MREKVINKLEELRLNYEIVEHPPIFTIGELDELGIKGKEKIAKNLFLRNDNGKQHYLIVIRQDKKVNLKELKSQIGSSRLSFASQERLMKHLKLTKGSVTPLGVVNDEAKHVKIYFDVDLKNQDVIGVHPNENCATVWLSLSDLVKVIEDNGNDFGYINV